MSSTPSKKNEINDLRYDLNTRIDALMFDQSTQNQELLADMRELRAERRQDRAVMEDLKAMIIR